MAKFFAGYAAVFYDANDRGTEYQISTSVRERIAPTAFDRAMRSSDDVVAAYNHNLDFLLGRRSNGTLRLSIDNRGLRYEADFDEHDPQHVTVMRKLIRGDLIGSSFSFLPLKENVVRDGADYIRTIEDLRLYEVGPVWSPAFKSASAQARGDLTVRETYSTPVGRRKMRVCQIEEELEREVAEERARAAAEERERQYARTDKFAEYVSVRRRLVEIESAN